MLFPILIFVGVLALVSTYLYWINRWLSHEEAASAVSKRVESRPAAEADSNHGFHTAAAH